jgi:ketosteroid isomerase-like protein
MKTLLLSLLILVLPAANAADALNQDNIRAMYAELTAAAQAKDVEGVLRHMTEDARVLIKDSGSNLDMDLDMTMYRDLLQQGWGAIEGYQVTVSIDSIDVAADGQSATVIDQTQESYQAQGQTLQTSTRETATLRLVDGAPKISLIEAVVQP